MASSDGSHVYAGAFKSITALHRKSNGGLGFGSCASDLGLYGCAKDAAPSLGVILALAASPDGTSLYAGSSVRKQAISTFHRKPDGGLSFEGCITNPGDAHQISGCSQAPHKSLSDVAGIAVSPDGDNLYSTSDEGSAVTTFARATDGTLTYQGCVSNSSEIGCGRHTKGVLAGAGALTVSRDGKTVYVAADRVDTVSWFHRQPNGALDFQGCIASKGRSGCKWAPGAAVDGPSGVAVAPDDGAVYVTASDGEAVAGFTRAPDGALTFRKCLTSYASRVCRQVPGHSLNFPEMAAVSADGRWLYVGSGFPGTLSLYRLNSPGAPVYDSCFADRGARGCLAPAKPSLGNQPFGLATDVDPASLYVAGRGVSALTR